MNSYFLKAALLPDGWCRNVRVTTENGLFQSIELETAQQPQDMILGTVIPAMPNAHSHVFQRAMAGLSEYKNSGEDNFWSWRDLMYQLANDLDEETLYEVAKNCYSEMMAAGYSSVCEFHYVHRRKSDFYDYYKHSEVILKAAADVGLPITFLPVLYAFSGVGDAPLNADQKRFELSTNEYIDLFQHLQNKLTNNQKLGICFHSIRAVNQQQMQQVLAALPDDVPVHIHIAEQQGEIKQALHHLGQRPVAWLYDHFDVNHRWSLVHATHLDDSEIKRIAQSGAVAVLCPLTEANLGDGIFPMQPFKELNGKWSIGSDSHIEIAPQQECKMLEYSQRLQYQQRNVCCDDAHPHVGTWLWLQAIAGGNASAMNLNVGLEVGCCARLIELKSSKKHAEQALDDWIFSDRTEAISQVL